MKGQHLVCAFGHKSSRIKTAAEEASARRMDLTRSYSNSNPTEGRLIPASTSFGRLAGIGPSAVSRFHNHGSGKGITVGRRPHNRGSVRGITMGRSQGWLSVRGRDNHRSADPQPSISRSNSPTGWPTRWTDFADVLGWQLELPRSIFAVVILSNDKDVLV